MILEIAELAAKGLVTLSEWVGDYVELLVEQRSRLRTEKRWAESDRLRADLETLGIVLSDTRSRTERSLSE